MSVVSLMLAGLSILFSAIALYFARFRPFTPEFAIGQIALGNVDMNTSRGKQRYVQIILPSEIHNLGAKSGVIEDISISLSSQYLGGTIYFFPHIFIKPDYVVKGQVTIELDRPWSPIVVPPYSHVRETILLLNMHPGPGPNALTAGDHRFLVRYRKLGEDDWITAYTGVIGLDEQNMHHIMVKVGNFHLPDMGIAEARDKLVSITRRNGS